MLVGAYQEAMGNNHNLFGAPHEAHIHIDEEGFLIKKVIKGTTVGAAAERARYERSLLHDGFRRLINRRVKDGELSEADGLRAGPVLRVTLRGLYLSRGERREVAFTATY